MAPLELTLEVPDRIIAGLARGDFQRTGGVVQWAAGTANAGDVVMWLREGSPAPKAMDALIPAAPSRLASLLSVAGPVASVLNLGATMAFGAATLRTLGVMDKKLDAIDKKLDGIRWTIEVGFQQTLAQLETVRTFHEADVVSELHSAADMAWLAQFLEPASPTRVIRVENALSHAIRARTRLHAIAGVEMEAAATWMAERSWTSQRLEPPGSVISALRRFRLLASALALNARILAEQGEFEAASALIERDSTFMAANLSRLGRATFTAGKGRTIYDYLLNETWEGTEVTVHRVVRWGRRYDSDRGSAEAIISHLRQQSGTLHALNSGLGLSKAAVRTFQEFVGELDGAEADIDRLLGYAAEFRAADAQNIGIEGYRSALRVPDGGGPPSLSNSWLDRFISAALPPALVYFVPR